MSALRPIPEPTPETRPFWDALHKGQLLGQRCKACGDVRVYPKARCGICLDDRLEWLQLSRRGRIYSYTIIHKASLVAFEPVPYALAAVDLEGGGRLLAQLATPPYGIAIGQKVHLALDVPRSSLAVPRFALVEEIKSSL